MIYYSTPFSLEKNLGKAYNHYMELLPNDDDYMVFTDADTMFLTWDYGKQIADIIQKHPNIGLFTCLTNRIGSINQRYNGIISDDGDIKNHRKIAIELQEKYYDEIETINKPISGLLMIIQKKVWNQVKFNELGLLRVDGDFSQRLIDSGFSVAIMKGIYIFHYYRLCEGWTYKKHLKLDNEEKTLLKDKTLIKEKPKKIHIKSNKHISRVFDIVRYCSSIVELWSNDGELPKLLKNNFYGNYLGIDDDSNKVEQCIGDIGGFRFSIDNPENTIHLKNDKHSIIVIIDKIGQIEKDIELFKNIPEKHKIIFTVQNFCEPVIKRIFQNQQSIIRRYGHIINCMSIEEVKVGSENIVYLIIAEK